MAYPRWEAHYFYVLGRPVISDYEYDMLCKKHDIGGGGGSDMVESL